MKKVKIISYPSKLNVEEAFDMWVGKENPNIQSIDLSTTKFESELWYILLIVHDV